MVSGLMPAGQVLAAQADTSSTTIQLKWKHQFQFAGYYAALEQGFYADEGLDVRLIEGGPEHAPVAELLSGKVDYAVADAGVLLDRAAGKDIVVLASIFQHSPQVLYTRDDVSSVADLRGKRVMLQEGSLTIEGLAMLQHFGIGVDDFVRQPIGVIEDLMQGKTDAFPGYSTNEGFMLRARGIPFHMFQPRDYGIDFYGDTLVTTGKELASRPERSEAVRRATIRGWEYALEHQSEIIDLIRAKYNSQHKSAAYLRYEAEGINTLMLADVVPVGFSNPHRWQNVARVFSQQGLMKADVDMDGFLYEPEASLSEALKHYRHMLIIASLIIVTLVLLLFVFQLRRGVRRRTRQLENVTSEYKDILDRMQDAYYRADLQGKMIWVSAACEKHLGYRRSELLGQPLEMLYRHPEDRVEFLKALEASGGSLQQYEIQMLHKDGSAIPAEVDAQYFLDLEGQVAGIEGTVRNISGRKNAEMERQQLTRQFQQAQKMESIGVLAGGIAHDFNNLLVAIMGNAELAMMEIPKGNPLREHLQHIFHASQRGADLVHQMLAYSGQGRFSMGNHNLNVCIRDVSELLGSAINKKAHVSFALQEDLPDTYADKNQLTQLLMNLITNASDALGGDAGEIRVRTGVKSLAATDFQRMYAAADLPSGDYVFVEVRDTGCGMDKATQGRIFDPFFTTKETGTGLGLAALLGIVTGHQGTLELISEPDHGTCFTVYFPVSEAASEKSEMEETASFKLNTSLQGTVLVVDDEPGVLTVVQKLLQREGLKVLTAMDGEHGVAVFSEHADSIALVILDLTMPRMDGEQAFHAIRAMNDSVPILLSSGFSESQAAERMKKLGLAGFISKPYRRKNLLAEVVRWGLLGKGLDSIT